MVGYWESEGGNLASEDGLQRTRKNRGERGKEGVYLRRAFPWCVGWR